MKPQVAVYTNLNETLIVWRYAGPIPNCVGFAIYRRTNDESAVLAQPLSNRVGFADEFFTKGEERPSTEWPFQRLVWSDYAVKSGDKVSYLIVPMLIQNGHLVKDTGNTSDWSKPVVVATGTTYQAFFNRGLVASQFFSRTNTDLQPAVTSAAETGQPKTKNGVTYNQAFKNVISGPPSKLRDFLGGCLSEQLFKILDDAIKDKSITLYIALYELKLDDLTQRLLKMGKRANLILANGTGKTPKGLTDKNDENAAARAVLKKKINVYDRMVPTSTRFAHNKFMVICKDGKPQQLLTGTTNWTPDGVFAQVNNSILINNPTLAAKYLEEWNELKASGNDSPQKLYDLNAKAKIAGKNLKAWCNPLNGLSDLADIESMLTAAKQGFLFLIFNPGPKNTVYNTILDLIKKRDDLFIRGVMNQDPGMTGSNPKPLVFFNLKDKSATNWDVVLPGTFKTPNSFWYPDPSDGIVTIHSKSIVIDPLGDNPIVITGSNNLGPKASGKNDDNFVVIKDKKLAMEYATNIMSVYAHYRWRYSVANKATDYKGLTKDPNWMKGYMNAAMQQQLTFLLGK